MRPGVWGPSSRPPTRTLCPRQRDISLPSSANLFFSLSPSHRNALYFSIIATQFHHITDLNNSSAASPFVLINCNALHMLRSLLHIGGQRTANQPKCQCLPDNLLPACRASHYDGNRYRVRRSTDGLAYGRQNARNGHRRSRYRTRKRIWDCRRSMAAAANFTNARCRAACARHASSPDRPPVNYWMPPLSTRPIRFPAGTNHPRQIGRSISWLS